MYGKKLDKLKKCLPAEITRHSHYKKLSSSLKALLNKRSNERDVISRNKFLITKPMPAILVNISRSHRDTKKSTVQQRKRKRKRDKELEMEMEPNEVRIDQRHYPPVAKMAINDQGIDRANHTEHIEVFYNHVA